MAIPEIYEAYYDVSSTFIVWTINVAFVACTALTIPSIMLLEMQGLRFVAIAGAGLNALGALVKCAGLDRTRWGIVFAGQTITSFAKGIVISNMIIPLNQELYCMAHTFFDQLNSQR